MNKGCRIADFTEMLAALTEKSKHGITDIHQLSAIPENFAGNACELSLGVLFDSKDRRKQVVRFANIEEDGSIKVLKYYGNHEENIDTELDSNIKVKVRIDEPKPYIRVELSGNGGYYVFIIVDGTCTYTPEYEQRTTV